MLSHIIMKNVIPEEISDADIVSTLCNTCRGSLTPENILQNYNESDLQILHIEKYIELFTHRYRIATTKLHYLASRLTDKPELVRLLTVPGLTPEALRLCHGRLTRLQSDQMVEKKMRMFHDTAQEWCDAVGEFMEMIDRRVPLLYRCERVE
jgi:hypothetical protein